MKSLIKTLLPSFVVKYLFLVKYRSVFIYDVKRFITYRGTLKDSISLEPELLSSVHAIEKGLNMPEFRTGFGKEKVLHISNILENKGDLISEYIYDYALSVLLEYKQTHLGMNIELSKEVIDSVDRLKNYRETSVSSQHVVSREKYFSNSKGNYVEVVKGRKSIREFSDQKIDKVVLNKAIDLSTECPSACNRQPYHVYVISETKQVDFINTIHYGNKGFGHTVPTYLIVTSNQSAFLSPLERNDVFINGGIYLNSLVNALYYYEIGSCILNWSVHPNIDIKLRNNCNIDNNDTIIAIVAIGVVSDIVKYGTSPKKGYIDIIK